MKYKNVLLFAFLGIITAGAHGQKRLISGKKTSDSVSVRKTAAWNPPASGDAGTAVQPSGSTLVVPADMIVMASFAPQPVTPTPAMAAALQWWLRINPADLGVYTSPFKLAPNTQYDTTLEKFIRKQSISMKGWMRIQETASSWASDSLVHLMALPSLIQVDLPFIDDVVAGFLGQMRDLKAVYYHSGTGSCIATLQSRLTDQGLALLLQNRNLEYVGFQANGNISNAGFAHFRGMDKLKVLYTHCWTGITDEALLDLEGCSSLETIYLIGSNITDQGLRNLLTHRDKMPNLTRVYVNGSRTTREGEADFRANWGRPIEVFYR
jgi:hypothetical protein